MDIENLTGKWHLKSRLFGGFDIMVEVEFQKWDDPTYGNGGGMYELPRKKYRKARSKEILFLKIPLG